MGRVRRCTGTNGNIRRCASANGNLRRRASASGNSACAAASFLSPVARHSRQGPPTVVGMPLPEGSSRIIDAREIRRWWVNRTGVKETH